MYLEVQLGESDPVTYNLNKSEIYIGSKSTNDIVISSSEISGKHLKLILTDDIWYVIDQGSTNGTFINDERLVPGRRAEFPVSEPISLGDKAQITLLSGKEVAKNLKTLKENAANSPTTDSSNSDKTRVISLKEMQAAKDRKQAKQRTVAAEKKRTESKRMRAEKDSLKRVTLLAVMWLSIGGVLQYAWVKYSDATKRKSTTQKAYIDRVVMDGTPDEQDEEMVIPADKIQPLDILTTHLKSPKCKRKTELLFCEKLEDFRVAPGGVLEVGSDLAFYVQERGWLVSAQEFIQNNNKPEILDEDDTEKKVTEIDPELIKKLATLMLINEGLGKTFPPSFKPRNLYIIFYSSNDELSSVAVFKSQNLPVIAMKYSLEEKKLNGKNGIAIAKELSRFVQSIYSDTAASSVPSVARPLGEEE